MKVKSVVVAVSLIVLASRADGSPVESFTTYGVLLDTASTFSVSSFDTSAPLELLALCQSLRLQAPPIGITPSVNAGRFASAGTVDPTAILVSAVAAPSPPAVFHEPSAWVMVLIGLGVVALGSIRRRH